LNTDPEIQSLDGCVLVRPVGPRLNAANATLLKSAVVDLAAAGRMRVIVSLAHLEQVDSSGLGVLISLHKMLAPPKGRLVLCEVPARIQPVLELTRLDRIFTLTADPDTAASIARSG
jgi:anti-sigma B factor antagonist